MRIRSLRAQLAIGSVIVLAISAIPIRTADVPFHPSLVPEAAQHTSRPTVQATTLRRRETLEMALSRAGVSRREAIDISAALRREVNLRRLVPGERLAVERGPDGALLGVVHERSSFERYEVRPDGASKPDAGTAWVAHAHRAAIKTQVAAVIGRVEDSLFASMERLGEKPLLAAKFVALFEWDFDFAADALPGDEFKILVEKRIVEGELIGYGDVLAAEYRSADRAALSAVLFSDGDGSPRHYDYQGRATRKMFLRAPLEFTRVTSGYSHARRHPILGGLRPHLAIDYGAPTGAPVRAVADGVVVASGPAGGYGLSVTIRHAQGYETMYNHLSRTLVRRGARVRQRDLIGRVGSTGLSTGPHLDYRLRRHGRPLNPLSEKFIPGQPVPRARMRAFQAHVRAIKDQLALAPLDSGTAAAREDGVRKP